MPIRFRCAYCNQLMGIARRKAGAVVRCPACAGQVIVPNPDAAQEPQLEADPAVFERSDFDDLFKPVLRKSRSLKVAPAPESAGDESQRQDPPTSAAKADQLAFDVEPVADSPFLLEPAGTVGLRPGIRLSQAQATLLCIILVLALALAFTGGLLVGLFLRRPAADEETAVNAATAARISPVALQISIKRSLF